MTTTAKKVLLTGATGFVGTHVYPALVSAGFEVICGSRRAREEAARDRSKTYVALDLGDPTSVAAALAGVDAAVYLVHSMAQGKGFEGEERRNAETFARAAGEAGVTRVVYLGGMRPSGKASRHLESRLRTGEVLRAGRAPVVELQATMIVGGGSESFRIVRDLAARLPFMLLPAWLKSVTEPVAVRDIAAAIVRALEMDLDESAVFTAPGPERLSGKDVILRTAGLLGHAPRVLEIPFVTPRLSTYWIRLVTRANPAVANELVEGLRSDIVSRGPEIWTSLPDFARTPFDVAVRSALAEEAKHLAPRARLIERILKAIAPWSWSPATTRT